jgi:hypothetical protein
MPELRALAGRGEEVPKTKVFISYSRKNMAFADRLETALKQREIEPLIDRSEIYAFEDWWKRIQALIAQADTVIFVLSPDAVASEVCAKEVAFAASLNKRFRADCPPAGGGQAGAGGTCAPQLHFLRRRHSVCKQLQSALRCTCDRH